MISPLIFLRETHQKLIQAQGNAFSDFLPALHNYSEAGSNVSRFKYHPEFS